MNAIYFTTQFELEQSKEFKNGNFVRAMRNMDRCEGDKQRFVLELVDFGTHLSHQDIIKINFNKIN